jgi:hypothetical protein
MSAVSPRRPAAAATADIDETRSGVGCESRGARRADECGHVQAEEARAAAKEAAEGADAAAAEAAEWRQREGERQEAKRRALEEQRNVLMRELDETRVELEQAAELRQRAEWRESELEELERRGQEERSALVMELEAAKAELDEARQSAAAARRLDAQLQAEMGQITNLARHLVDSPPTAVSVRNGSGRTSVSSNPKPILALGLRSSLTHVTGDAGCGTAQCIAMEWVHACRVCPFRCGYTLQRLETVRVAPQHGR